ncbi:hypothetical protein KY312_02430 [Candidatus Woesearchaeota archaeon]|nr:hypothetical protein [Candidatus Woesearchaeota archaeon]
MAKKEGEEEDTIAVKGAKKASDWAKKLRAFWRPEYKAGRKLKRVTKKMERASKTIIEALEAIMSGLEGLKENPDSKEARKTIIESINKIIPAIREEVAAKENFETLKARLEEWKTGQIKLAEDIKAALEMLRKDIEAKLAEGDLVDERRKELEDIMAESNWDIEVIDTELKLLEGEIIDFSKVEKIIEVIEGILPITVANLKQIEEHVKEGEYNEAYVLTKETLKNEKVIEKDFKIVMDTIKEIRVLISAERKQLRRIRKEIEKKLPKIKEKMGTSAEKYRKVAGAS